MTRLGIDLFPEVNFRSSKSASSPGRVAEEVETLVTRPIEDACRHHGVKRVISSALESRALVGWELRLEIDRRPPPPRPARRWPPSAAGCRSRSRIPHRRFDVAALPIMTFAVGSSQRSDVARRKWKTI